MSTHREICDKFLDGLVKSQSSSVISTEKYHKILQHLQNPSDKVEAGFRFWVKMKQFFIKSLPALNLIDFVAKPNPSKEEGSPNFVRVIHSDMIYEIVDHIHSIELIHAGYRKCLEVLKRTYDGITRSYVQEFCKHCPTCQLTQPQKTKPLLKPIIEREFMSRVQVDLIDMRLSPDGEYQHICHFMDHFSKFHIIFPLVGKSAKEISKMFAERVLAYVGPPKIFHTDNGSEFVNDILHSLLRVWNRDVTLVNGRPRHSQSQGLIERGNKEINKMIRLKKAALPIAGTYPWVSWLPEIMYTLNMTKCRTTDEIPYHKTDFNKETLILLSFLYFW